MTPAYKVVLEILQQKKAFATEPTEYCCLCLDIVDENAKCIHDEVLLTTWTGDTMVEMQEILTEVVSNDVTQNISVLKFVCEICTKSAIQSYSFKKTCQENSKQLQNAVETLTTAFENTTDSLDDYQCLFMAIDPKKATVEQFYDTQSPVNPKQTPLARFKFMAYGENAKLFTEKRNYTAPKDGVRKQKDFSTIFIKTHELMLNPNSNEFKCKMCMKVYPTSGSLRQHFFSVHFKKEFPCSVCSKGFGTMGLLQTHISQCHSFVTCDKCGKKLLNRTSTLKRHELTHDKRFSKVCHRCGRSYKKSGDYERHMQQATCEVPSKVSGKFICDYCGKEAHYRHQLLAHIKYEHLGHKGFICKWCNRKCYNESALKTHILKHTKEKNFVCSECGGKFVTRQSLINHMRLHTGERPYPCEYCSLSFLSASRRRDHVERNHVNNTYDCDLCDARYNARRSLIKHKKTHLTESGQ